MQTSEILKAWGKILKGQRPSLSIEITRECPLRCPGCYAYEDAHLGGGATLRDLNDRKGQELVDGVLEVVDRLRPLHLSLVGGDPLVRYRELETLVPLVLGRGIHVQVVTSAFRTLPEAWPTLRHMNVVVSIDGLQPEHDSRRKPATYERILKNIAGQKITIHSTITGQLVKRPDYLQAFLQFWAPRPEVNKIWFSIFTPQIGDDLPEILTAAERQKVIADLLELRKQYPKLDMPEGLIRQLASPPHDPGECVFAQTTQTISADLTTKITPCQFGGNPDCGSCGCIASMGLAAVAEHKLAGFISVGSIFRSSIKLGRFISKEQPKPQQPVPAFRVLPATPQANTVSEPVALKKLRALSGRLGSDRLLVQASSGNTSIKLNGVMWIKATGRWLMEAETPHFLIPVELERAKQCLETRLPIPETQKGWSGNGCASIETAMHAVLPQKVVIHVHSVNAIAWSVRTDAQTFLKERLSHFYWQWIPYVRSGADLAREVQRVLSSSPLTDVLLLGNHGLVICGDTCDSAEQRLKEVERCLAIDARTPPEPHAASLEQMVKAGWSLPSDPIVHGLGTDPLSREILSGGFLYPCHAIFLPSTAPAHLQNGTLRIQEQGVLCSSEMTPAERETLFGLGCVVQRIHASAPLRYLSPTEVADLLQPGSE